MTKEYDLFGRRYELIINDGEIQKEWSDLDISFKITKTNDTTPNELDLEVFNLNPSSRDFIYRRNLNVVLRAGYTNSIGLIFRGNTELINHERQNVDYISKLYCKDGGAAVRNLVISKSFKKDTPLNTVIESVLKKLQDVPPGIQSQLQNLNKLYQANIDLLGFKEKKKPKKKTRRQKDIPPVKQQQDQYLKKKQDQRQKAEDKKLQKGLIVRGRAVSRLRYLCDAAGLDFNITDQAINIWPKGLALTEEVIVLNAATGLLGSPEKTENGSWKVRSLLRHEFNPGTLVHVQSRYLDSVMLIQRVEHYGATNGADWCSEIFCTEFDI